ncbi:MAG: TolC family protein [Saprospiraceae bacterium]|nr:TolC family protein [Saprospiraceae bacterium]
MGICKSKWQKSELLAHAKFRKRSVSLESGQINTTLVDYRFDASQSLGNLAANKQRKELAKTNIALFMSEKALLERQIIFQVQQNWHAWAYHTEQIRLLQQQRDLYQNIVEKAALQLNAGEINRLDKILVDNQLILLSKTLTNAELENQQALSNLRQTAFLNQDYILPENAFRELTLPGVTGSASSLTAPFLQQSEVAKAETILQQKQLSPEWSFGYFNQSIRPDFALQG